MIFIVLLVSAGRFVYTQQSQSANDCQRTVHKADFESRTDGPFVQEIGYSKALRACIVIRQQGFPAAHQRIEMYTDIVNTADARTVWHDHRSIPQGRQSDNRYPALDQEKVKLQIELHPIKANSTRSSKAKK